MLCMHHFHKIHLLFSHNAKQNKCFENKIDLFGEMSAHFASLRVINHQANHIHIHKMRNTQIHFYKDSVTAQNIITANTIGIHHQ